MPKRVSISIAFILSFILCVTPLAYPEAGAAGWAGLFSVALASTQGGSIERITATPTKLNVVNGQKVSFRAIIAPYNADDLDVVYSNKTLQLLSIKPDNMGAVVVEFQVIGNAKAKVQLEFKSKTRKKTSQKISVTIKPTEVSSIALEPEAYTLKEKDIFQLQSQILPPNADNKAVTWTSSNKKIATVDKNGRVTAKKPGSATITAKTKSGAKTARTQITVEGVPVTAVQMSADQIVLKYGKSATLKATVYPSNASDKTVTWTTNASDIATVSKSGKVTAKKKEGAATITAQSGNKIIAQCTVYVSSTGTLQKASDVAKPLAQSPISPSDIYLQEFEDEVIRLINIEREQRGLVALVKDDTLTQAARVRAKELEARYEHVRPDGRKWSTVLNMQSNTKYGEIIYKMILTPKAAVQGWMNSDAHRNGILTKELRFTGVGVYQDSRGNLYWAELFSSKKS